MTKILTPFKTALQSAQKDNARDALISVADDCLFHMCFPFGDLQGAGNWFDTTLGALFDAFPDLERRDWINIQGQDDDGNDWIGTAGHYVGTFSNSFLDIPPTGRFAHMRFHEFYRVSNGKIVETQMIWDIPELMMQADAWAMPPSLGREMLIPAPQTQDGLGPHDDTLSSANRQLIIDMLMALIRHPKEPVEAMELPKFWHPQMNWYGPAGIGTARGIEGFRNHHQIPFLAAMPDRGQYEDEIKHHFFAQGNYIGVTGWPNMAQTLSGGGWLGIAPVNKKITLRSLDFWRVEGDKIRENWVLVDLLDMYNQIGVDVFSRMRSLNQGRHIHGCKTTERVS